MIAPGTPEELAAALSAASSAGQSILLGGRFSKNSMAGPVRPADVTISTRGLARVLQYEPDDLTASVQAGMPWTDFTAMLAAHRQMVPLDPPFASQSTVGGVVASNSSGHRRRLYGTARDLVIGMKFATLEGKVVESGGMVVKNVAGLDMAKLMIGSFGTLAAIAVVNFKLLPVPAVERSFLLSFAGAAEAVEARDRILHSALQPAAVDLFNEGIGGYMGARGWTLAVQAGGNEAVVRRYERELAALGSGAAFEGGHEAALWGYIREFTPRFLAANPEGAVLRVSCTLAAVLKVLEASTGPALARAASGVCYLYYADAAEAARVAATAQERGWIAVIEHAPEHRKEELDLWPNPGPDFEMMVRIKQMLDPAGLLNRGRLYRRI